MTTIIPGQLMFDDPALAPSPVASPPVDEPSPAEAEPSPPVEEPSPAEAEPSPPVDEPAPVAPAATVGLEDDADADGLLGSTLPLAVEVIRSSRRKKTAQARLVGTTIEIRIPARCSRSEEVELVEHFTAKFERSRSTDAIDLDARARRLADSYGLPRPTSIRWVSNQRQRWGSCTPSDGSIRLSDRMAGFPDWVIDYVIVHELAHLRVPNHDREFWALVEAYPRCERARGFLIAKGLDEG